jgi:hypothetical protein
VHAKGLAELLWWERVYLWRNVGISGGRSLTRPFRDARLSTIVARTHMYTYDANVWDFSIVQGPFSVARAKSTTLRFATFSIAEGQ